MEFFSRIAKRLTQLNRKGTPFIWSKAGEDSFQDLKKKFITTLVLMEPDSSESFIV